MQQDALHEPMLFNAFHFSCIYMCTFGLSYCETPKIKKSLCFLIVETKCFRNFTKVGFQLQWNWCCITTFLWRFVFAFNFSLFIHAWLLNRFFFFLYLYKTKSWGRQQKFTPWGITLYPICFLCKIITLRFKFQRLHFLLQFSPFCRRDGDKPVYCSRTKSSRVFTSEKNK